MTTKLKKKTTFKPPVIAIKRGIRPRTPSPSQTNGTYPPKSLTPAEVSAIQIEHNIPLTSQPRGIYAPLLRKLRIGDSFVINRDQVSRIMGSSIKLGVKLSQRYIGDGKSRLWRVAETNGAAKSDK